MSKKAYSHEQIIENLLKSLPISLDKEEKNHAEQLIVQYYHRISSQDLLERSEQDLIGALLNHLKLAYKRDAVEHKTLVYNPDQNKHGWQSTHTIVQIVTTNTPFLVDSISMALNRMGVTIHLTIHPVVSIKRNSEGTLTKVNNAGSRASGAIQESLMHFEIDKLTTPKVLNDITKEIISVLDEVNLACNDWQAMREQVKQITKNLKQSKSPHDAKKIKQVADFCRWIEAGHFTFLGFCEDRVNDKQLSFKKGSGLGLLRTGHNDLLPTGTLTDLSDDLIIVTKANSRSRIHRPAYMDFIGINRYDKNGKLVGQSCILGLFTSAAYHRNTNEIPLLRDKVSRVLEKSQLPVGGHDYKELENIFESYPRDSLFAIDDDDLCNISLGILALQERQRIRFFARHDKFDRFYSCLVYVPKERYSRELREKIQAILISAYKGVTSQFHTHFSESVLARIHFIVRINPGSKPKLDETQIEAKIINATRSWKDHLRGALIDEFGEERGMSLLNKYSDAFSVSYQSDFVARSAVYDIDIIDSLSKNNLAIQMYKPYDGSKNSLRMKLFSKNTAIPPSDALPVVENMGLRVLEEHPYKVELTKRKTLWIHDFIMQSHSDGIINTVGLKTKFQDAFLSVWNGDAENDGFNQLVIKAGLDWREVAVIRAYNKYLRQIGIRFSETYMIECLVNNTQVAHHIIELFVARFNPAHDTQTSKQQTNEIRQRLNQQLELVSNLDDDRILRSFINLVDATIRTNYFQPEPNGATKSYISFKFDASEIKGLPLPTPLYEVFVYSPRVEAVHLRGGRVARGGLRWSDRREDFRTEILGLVKAQLVKNAVIVPTGSKGGFFVKRPPIGGDRAAIQAEGIACYKIFMRGLLDITDNLVKGEIVPPESVVRHDNDDPYLVVAADKGTATFSDIANGVAHDYGFWLDDAFASGGSVGYDHKGMGITARGAWESVKRNFKELGHNTQTQAFSVIGIGDMMGDVFGNGMLLSKKIKLVGAFNHLHIVLDPNPSPEKSYIERQRLFNLPRSSWADYNAKLISKGGGIFERSAKSIPLSAEIKTLLNVSQDSMTPTALINAMLKAPIDLLWNGGIGTYVKASTETHEDASDRANDSLRVNGKELRCKVVGEGGNLGMTQLGRVEFCRNGGKCYTDFIDNSAGVDTSDHEVNIKILLNEIVSSGALSVKQRNKLLADMTDTVGELVLKDNYDQTQAISIARTQAPAHIREHLRFMQSLEKGGILNRELEFLPSNAKLNERAASKEGLTAPEISVLLAYSKMDTYNHLLESDAPDDPFMRNAVEKYFPQALVKNYRDTIVNHRLRREIVATYITNKMVNQAGPLFAFQLSEITGASHADIARAFTCAREIFNIDEIWHQIESLDNKVNSDVQIQMLSDASGLLERATLWLLRNRRMPINILSTIEFFKPDIEKLSLNIPKPLAKPNKALHKKRKDYLTKQGVPVKIAEQVAGFVALSSSFDIVEVAKLKKVDVELVCSVYFALGELLDLHRLRDGIANLHTDNHWHLLAKSSLRNQLHRIQRMLTADLLANGKGGVKTLIETWSSSNIAPKKRFKNVLRELKRSGKLDFPMLSVALGELQILRQSNLSASTKDSG